MWLDPNPRPQKVTPAAAPIRQVSLGRYIQAPTPQQAPAPAPSYSSHPSPVSPHSVHEAALAAATAPSKSHIPSHLQIGKMAVPTSDILAAATREAVRRLAESIGLRQPIVAYPTGAWGFPDASGGPDSMYTPQPFQENHKGLSHREFIRPTQIPQSGPARLSAQEAHGFHGNPAPNTQGPKLGNHTPGFFVNFAPRKRDLKL